MWAGTDRHPTYYLLKGIVGLSYLRTSYERGYYSYDCTVSLLRAVPSATSVRY